MAEFSPRGTFTALVTPFTEGETHVDWAAFEHHVEAQVKAGIDGLVPCGTTGESATLSDEEKKGLIERSVRAANGQSCVLAGIGSSDTRKTLLQAEAALAAGADALMLVMPSYTRPSQGGLARHIAAVARASACPIVLYNIPGRTAVSLELDTLRRVVEESPNVVGLKDATGNVTYCQSAIAQLGDRLSVLSGDDALTVPMMSVGAQGVISVTSNLLPKAVGAVVKAASEGRFGEAAKRHLELLPAHEVLFSSPSPSPIKAALAGRGTMLAGLRPPMCTLEPDEATRVCAALDALSL